MDCAENDRFTNQQPRIATEKECAAPWGGHKNGAAFRCYFCGYKFTPGDRWRWVCATGHGAINPLVCGPCDGPDALERWLVIVATARRRFWWLYETPPPVATDPLSPGGTP